MTDTDKKIGILTFFNRMNYGAELQAYALFKKIRDFGYDCELIDVLSPNHPLAKKPQLYKPFLASHKKLSLKNQINTKIQKELNRIAKSLHSKSARLRKKRFEDFKDRYLRSSERKYYSVDNLYDQRPPYDILVTGSDQVWNPQATLSSPEPYFLTFAPDEIKKISYAASFGVSGMPPALRNKYAKWLTSMNHISVRENQGARIVRDISGREATVVLDPTLLIDSTEWNTLAASIQNKKPYILLYVRMFSPYITKLAYYLSKRTGYSIIRIPRGYMREGIEYKINHCYDAGPREFLALFNNASFVLTSSFHGTAFSINYNKPFYTVIRKHGPVNSRMESLLGNLNLKERLLYSGDAFPAEKDFHIDFSEAKILLEKERNKSLKFLKDAIGN